MTWDEWEQVLDEIRTTWPAATQGDGYLTVDAAGEYRMMDTLRSWFGLLQSYEQSHVFSAVFKYANTDPSNQWPPQGTTLARLAHSIASEDRARESRRPALPAPDPDVIDGRTWAQRNGYESIWDAVKGRCRRSAHHGMATDATCRLCNGLAPAGNLAVKL